VGRQYYLKMAQRVALRRWPDRACVPRAVRTCFAIAELSSRARPAVNSAAGVWHR